MTDELPAIAAAVIVQDGRVLLVRRQVPEDELVWQFPAGKVAPGELLAQAAERETLEETGLTVEAVTFLGERLHPVTRRRISYVACRVISGTAYVASERELMKVAWCNFAQISAAIPAGIFGPVQRYLATHMENP